MLGPGQAWGIDGFSLNYRYTRCSPAGVRVRRAWCWRLRLLASLIANYSTGRDSWLECVARHGVYDGPKGIGVDGGNLRGDYFYLEALTRFVQPPRRRFGRGGVVEIALPSAPSDLEAYVIGPGSGGERRVGSCSPPPDRLVTVPGHTTHVLSGHIATDITAPLRADPDRQRSIVERIPAGRWGAPGGPRRGPSFSWPPTPLVTRAVRSCRWTADGWPGRACLWRTSPAT